MFGVERNDSLVHEVVKAELAARRQGTHATKTRGMVAGGRAKPWRQKGTGRARAGTTRAPQWTGGGVVFGPQPAQLHRQGQPQGAPQGARIALSAHAAGGTLAAVDAAKFKAPKTKQAAELVGRLARAWTARAGGGRGGETRSRARSATSSAPTSIDVSALEVADVVWARHLAVSKVALERLEGSA